MSRCWDGKNLDSPDHQSHMFNTVNSDGFNNAGACPATHPVRVPQVTFETVWDTQKFNSMWTSGPNPFVWSFEGTGGGTHGDYMFGWKGDSLQRAMDKPECFYDGCGAIKKQAMTVANQCNVKDFVGEKTDGCMFPPKSPLTRIMNANVMDRAQGTSWCQEVCCVNWKGGRGHPEGSPGHQSIIYFRHKVYKQQLARNKLHGSTELIKDRLLNTVCARPVDVHMTLFDRVVKLAEGGSS